MTLLPLALLGLGTLGGAYQIRSGLVQMSKTNKLKLQDTRTDADREALTMAQMRANSQRMPGMGQAIDDLSQDSADARALEQTTTSGATFLAANTIIRRDQDQRLSQLNTQSATYQEFAKRELATELRRQSALQQQDKENYERSKTILKKKAYMNIFGGLIIWGLCFALCYWWGLPW